MIRNKLYYKVKPFVPPWMRMRVRRWLAKRQRRLASAIWPILPGSEMPPRGWRGWPQGKQFAVVLTHDVEGSAGLARVRQLAEFEMTLGFRSSFNFIPEGDYKVMPELRTWLTANGFEVGVHDLHHDGKLFDSLAGFEKKATRINQHIREWGASGYRSGFMLRNLDWLHRLDIAYDASTFDTDPFEPQPDGAGTIFPYWIPAPVNRASGRTANPVQRQGYVELPYTLPQDSTMFLLLRETTPEIWLRKTDWLARHGGMALVNVHPDYIRFEGEASSTRRTFPIEHYRQLLVHIREHHRAAAWNALPKEVAAWHHESQTPNGTNAFDPNMTETAQQPGFNRTEWLGGKRAAVLLYSNYPSDPRPRRAAEAMVDAGMAVDLLCLTEYESDLREEVVNGVRVFRLPMKRLRGSKWNYLWLYSRFLASSFWFLLRNGLGGKYDVVHVHNMPDFLVFSALFSKLRGARIILDLHDPMPELMMTIYGIGRDQLMVKMLKLLEKCSIMCSDAVITVNEACKKLFSIRSCPPAKIHVIMNSPDEKIFHYRDVGKVALPAPATARQVIMYHGSLVERHGLDLAVVALPKIRKSFPNAELRIYGHETPYLRKVLDSLPDAGMRGAVQYLGGKPLEEIAAAIRECDVGIIPNRRSLFTEINTPTRIFEYLSQAKPVVAPHAPGILDYFGPDELFYFEMDDADDLAEKIERVFREPEAAQETVRRGQAVYREHAWSKERHRFINLVAELLGVEQTPQVKTPAGGAPAIKSGR